MAANPTSLTFPILQFFDDQKRRYDVGACMGRLVIVTPNGPSKALLENGLFIRWRRAFKGEVDSKELAALVHPVALFWPIWEKEGAASPSKETAAQVHILLLHIIVVCLHRLLRTTALTDRALHVEIVEYTGMLRVVCENLTTHYLEAASDPDLFPIRHQNLLLFNQLQGQGHDKLTGPFTILLELCHALHPDNPSVMLSWTRYWTITHAQVVLSQMSKSIHRIWTAEDVELDARQEREAAHLGTGAGEVVTGDWKAYGVHIGAIFERRFDESWTKKKLEKELIKSAKTRSSGAFCKTVLLSFASQMVRLPLSHNDVLLYDRELVGIIDLTSPATIDTFNDICNRDLIVSQLFIKQADGTINLELEFDDLPEGFWDEGGSEDVDLDSAELVRKNKVIKGIEMGWMELQELMGRERIGRVIFWDVDVRERGEGAGEGAQVEPEW